MRRSVYNSWFSIIYIDYISIKIRIQTYSLKVWGKQNQIGSFIRFRNKDVAHVFFKIKFIFKNTLNTFIWTLVVCVSTALFDVVDTSFSLQSFRFCFPGEIGREIDVTSELSVFIMWVWIVALYEPRGEFDSSESRQYTTPVWFTWMLGVHPIPAANQNALRNSKRQKQYWIQYQVLLPLLEKLYKHFCRTYHISHFREYAEVIGNSA